MRRKISLEVEKMKHLLSNTSDNSYGGEKFAKLGVNHK
jgi:hypothetical protein